MTSEYLNVFLIGVAGTGVAIAIRAAIDLVRQRRWEGPDAADWSGPKEIDEDNPPYYGTVVVEPGDPQGTCDCHGRPLKDGERVLIWPTTEVLCKRTYSSKDVWE